MRIFWQCLLTVGMLCAYAHAAGADGRFTGAAEGCFSNIDIDPHIPNRLYATSKGAGILRSDDLGKHWYSINQGLVDWNVSSLVVAPSDSEIIYAATNAGLYVSHSGKPWVPADTVHGHISFAPGVSYRPIAIDAKDPHRVCVGTAKGQVFCSENEGIQWKDMDPKHMYFPGIAPVTAMFLDEGKLYVASAHGLSRCIIGQMTCELLRGPGNVSDLLISHTANSIMYAAGEREILMSRNAGTTWTKLSPIPHGKTYRISVDDELNLYAFWVEGTEAGIVVSTDHGQTWVFKDYQVPTDITPDASCSVPFQSAHLIALKTAQSHQTLLRSQGKKLWRSDDEGDTWIPLISLP